MLNLNAQQKGNLGEASAIKYFASCGYEVYTGTFGGEKFDLIICKEGICYRVSVKSTSHANSYGKYYVTVSQGVSKGKGGGYKPFDRIHTDLLFVYIVPEDEILVYNAKKIKSKWGFLAHTVPVNGKNKKAHLSSGWNQNFEKKYCKVSKLVDEPSCLGGGEVDELKKRIESEPLIG